jgi:hypothetical protein
MRQRPLRSKTKCTSVGYVARNQTIARLGQLPTDCTLTPDGSLLVATHSGPPDWGTGPEGKGSLFKIRYSDALAAQPSQVFALSKTQFCIAMDRPLDANFLKQVAGSIELIGGPYVQAGDNYASLKPPYEVVKEQSKAPREKIAILAVSTTPDLRNIHVTTEALRSDWQYNVRLPSTEQTATEESRKVMDLSFELTGGYATWLSPVGSKQMESVEITLPHLDSQVARKLTVGSSLHDAFWNKTEQAGRLVLTTRFVPDNFLEPAPQLGSQLDYEPPIESISLIVGTDRPIVAHFPGSVVTNNEGAWQFQASHSTGRPEVWKMTLETLSDKPIAIGAFSRTNEDGHERPIALKRFRLERELFLDTKRFTSNVDSNEVEDADSKSRKFEMPRFRLAFGPKIGESTSLDPSWLRGRDLFHGEKAACSKCHSLQPTATVVNRCNASSLPAFQGIENQDPLFFVLVLSPKDGARARKKWVKMRRLAHGFTSERARATQWYSEA